ncbi:MAG: type I-C CRISPR-associated protein Cas8c/Csd1 [Prevotella sp.]
MILKALYDYYNRCDNLPAKGMEEKEIGFLIVLSPEGQFLRFEDCRTGKDHARVYLVKKHVGRSSAAVANYLYDNSAYVLGYSEKSNGKEQLYFDTFKEKVETIAKAYPSNKDISAIRTFYDNSRETILDWVSQDILWEDIKKNLSKKYSTFSFRIEGDLKIVAEKKELLQLEDCDDETKADSLCLISGKHGPSVDTTTATMIPGSQATAKLVAFQVNSGYDSYGKTKCRNAPISEEAEFAYTTALKSMLQKGSRNKFMLGSRTFVFWASNNNEASLEAEDSLFELLGFSEEPNDDPNANLMKVRKVFESIYSGILKTDLDDKFYILGLAPNSARIAVVYWSETTLKDFAEKILDHFNDMEIHDTRKDKKPYMGIREIISSVTLGGKMSDATPNLPEAVVKSIFQGLPYPATLYSACIRRIRAEQKLTITRAAIIKAYLNRQRNNNKKIDIMLDKDNNNQGYLCGRLFAVLDKIQEDANNISSIRERYMNAASATPSAVFATILNLSVHHSEKLDERRRIYFEKLKQEILDKVSADGFPTHLDLQDQGRFFVGYYHQRQDFFTSKKEQ